MPSSRNPARPARELGLVALATSLVACAGIVGADFDSVHGAESTDGGTLLPTTDAQVQGDASQVTLPSDGGACPTRFLDCGGECFDISTSALHCGDCATACKGDPHGAAVCVASHCELACNPGYVQCTAGCCAVVTPDASSGNDASVADAATSTDDGGADGGSGIPCAAATCSDGTDFCCGAALGGDGSAVGDTCLPTQNDTSGLTCPYVFACAGTADCQGPGGICCYDTSANTQDPNYQSSFCAQSCNGGGPYVQLCTPGSNDCLGGTTCAGVVSGQGLQTTYAYCE